MWLKMLCIFLPFCCQFGPLSTVFNCIIWKQITSQWKAQCFLKGCCQFKSYFFYSNCSNGMDINGTEHQTPLLNAILVIPLKCFRINCLCLGFEVDLFQEWLTVSLKNRSSDQQRSCFVSRWIYRRYVQKHFSTYFFPPYHSSQYPF